MGIKRQKRGERKVKLLLLTREEWKKEGSLLPILTQRQKVTNPGGRSYIWKKGKGPARFIFLCSSTKN